MILFSVGRTDALRSQLNFSHTGAWAPTSIQVGVGSTETRLQMERLPPPLLPPPTRISVGPITRRQALVALINDKGPIGPPALTCQKEMQTPILQNSGASFQGVGVKRFVCLGLAWPFIRGGNTRMKWRLWVLWTFLANSNRLKKISFLKTRKNYSMDLELQINR